MRLSTWLQILPGMRRRPRYMVQGVAFCWIQRPSGWAATRSWTAYVDIAFQWLGRYTRAGRLDRGLQEVPSLPGPFDKVAQCVCTCAAGVLVDVRRAFWERRLVILAAGFLRSVRHPVAFHHPRVDEVVFAQDRPVGEGWVLLATDTSDARDTQGKRIVGRQGEVRAFKGR